MRTRKVLSSPVKSDAGNYTMQEAIDEVDATMRMEGMPLSDDDIELLKVYKSGRLTGDQIRKRYWMSLIDKWAAAYVRLQP